MKIKTGILIIVFTLLMSACTCTKTVKSDDFLYMEEVYAFAKKNFNSGNWNETLKWYDRLNEDFPGNSYTAEGLFIKGYIFKTHIKNIPIAEYNFNELINKYSDSEFYNSALFELEHIDEPDFMPKFEK